MRKEKFSCPSCGSPHEWPQPIPAMFRCCACKSEFPPVEELHRYTIHICRPGQSGEPLESYYSGRPFIIPRRGDRVMVEHTNPSEGESLRVADIDFEFERIRNTTRQVIRVLTEIAEDRE